MENSIIVLQQATRKWLYESTKEAKNRKRDQRSEMDRYRSSTKTMIQYIHQPQREIDTNEGSEDDDSRECASHQSVADGHKKPRGIW